MSYSYNTCRYCHRCGADGFVKYGTRHYACHKCYLDAGKTLSALPSWQISQFPWLLLVDRGLLDQAQRLLHVRSSPLIEDPRYDHPNPKSD